MQGDEAIGCGVIVEDRDAGAGKKGFASGLVFGGELLGKRSAGGKRLPSRGGGRRVQENGGRVERRALWLSRIVDGAQREVIYLSLGCRERRRNEYKLGESGQIVGGRKVSYDAVYT